MITAGVVGKLEHSFDPLKLFRAKFLSKVSTKLQVQDKYMYEAIPAYSLWTHVRMHAVPRDYT